MIDAYQRLLAGELTFESTRAEKLLNPIGIGAVGGSGTRLLLRMLETGGVAMASPLNRAGDAYEWPPFAKLLSEDMLRQFGRDRLMHNILRVFETLLLQRRANLGLSGRVGWKVPGTFHWLEDMTSFFPDMQYLHLVRHGLDMAYSGNQNQARSWSGRLGIDLKEDDRGKLLPASMLEYWLAANEKVLQGAADQWSGNVLIVRFESLCDNPGLEIERIFSFLELPLKAETRQELAQLVARPDSVGRYRNKPWRSDFSAQQLSRLEALGYTAD